MALADFTRVKKRIIQILGANDTAYGATVSGNMGAFPYDQEITDACLESDAMICTESYFAHPTLGTRFHSTSGTLANGDALPEFIGRHGKVELQDSDGNWGPGAPADSKDSVVNLVRYGTGFLGGAENIEGLYFIDRGYIFHSSTGARVKYPAYTKTASLQSLDMHEQALIAGALMMLYKHGSPLHSEPNSAFYGQFFEKQKERILMNQDLEETPTTGGN
jgi:hypothetical protein